MEKIILILFGAAAMGYLIRFFWKEAKGEGQCTCSQGSCGLGDKPKGQGGCCNGSNDV